MKFVIVDDDPMRHIRIREFLADFWMGGHFPQYDVATYRAVRELTSPETLLDADIVFLDHDMCEAPLGETCPRSNRKAHCECPTGADLVRSIIDPEGDLHIDPQQSPRFIVHSANSVGGLRMVQDLEHYGYNAVRADFTAWGAYGSSQLWKKLSK